MYTQDYIDNLIGCLKKIKSPPAKKMKLERGAYRNSCTMIAVDTGITFSVFYMQNATFPENFSIGLTFNPPDQKGTVTLIRCNGKHGPTSNNPHHSVFHIHRVTADRISKGMWEEGQIEATDQYADFHGAIQYFISIVNLHEQDRKLYFSKNPGSQQTEIDYGNGRGNT